MDTNNDKADEYKQWRRSRDKKAKALDDFRDPNNPLQIATGRIWRIANSTVSGFWVRRSVDRKRVPMQTRGWPIWTNANGWRLNSASAWKSESAAWVW